VEVLRYLEPFLAIRKN